MMRTLAAVKASPANLGREGETRLVVLALHDATLRDLFVIEVRYGGRACAGRQTHQVDDLSVLVRPLPGQGQRGALRPLVHFSTVP